jgi:transcriptional regulator with XRE-family HTH domain
MKKTRGVKLVQVEGAPVVGLSLRELLVAARRARGLTQTELAELVAGAEGSNAAVVRSALARVEAGGREAGQGTVTRVLEALGYELALVERTGGKKA